MTGLVLQQTRQLCLPDASCMGFDICFAGDEDRNGNEKICKVRNASNIELCDANDRNECSSPCESYSRVSKHRCIWNTYMSQRLRKPSLGRHQLKPVTSSSDVILSNRVLWNF
jgi:hypothetical protein